MLHLLARRSLQCPLDIRLGPHGDDPNVDDVETGVRDARVGGQAGSDPLAHGSHALGQCLGKRHAHEQIQCVLLRELGEEAANMFERRRSPHTEVGIDPEVDSGGRRRRVDHSVRDRGLHGHVLEIEGATVEEQRLFTVIDRNFAQGGVERSEPERLARTVVHQSALAEVADVRGGVRPEVPHKQELRDVSHGLLFLVT